MAYLNWAIKLAP